MFLIPNALADAAEEIVEEIEEIAQTAAPSVEMNIGVGMALQYALVGFLTVFVALLIIIGAIKLTSVFVERGEKSQKEEKSAAPAAAAPAAAAPVSAPKADPAPGSCGDVKLYNVSNRDAAMIMAIVADEMKTPLNELRFISIKEIA